MLKTERPGVAIPGCVDWIGDALFTQVVFDKVRPFFRQHEPILVTAALIDMAVQSYLYCWMDLEVLNKRLETFLGLTTKFHALPLKVHSGKTKVYNRRRRFNDGVV